MAEYRDLYWRIRDTGADLTAVAVDPPEMSESVRRQLRLPFPVLCDTTRRVAREWDVFNEEEKGGIAVPSVFVIGPDRRIRFASGDRMAARVPAATVVNFLFSGADVMPSQPRRRRVLPGLLSFGRAIRNGLRLRP